jgi:hypothetical protein
VIPGHFPENASPDARPIVPTQFTIKWQNDVEEWQRKEQARAGKSDWSKGQLLVDDAEKGEKKRGFATFNDLAPTSRSDSQLQRGSSSAKKAKQASTQTTPSKTFNLAGLATANKGELNVVADILTELKQARSHVETSTESHTSTHPQGPKQQYQNLNSQTRQCHYNTQTQDQASDDDDEGLFVTPTRAPRQVNNNSIMMSSSPAVSSPTTASSSSRPTTLVLPFSGATISVTQTAPAYPLGWANGESKSVNGYTRPA